jgi:acyl-CoA thioesterase I
VLQHCWKFAAGKESLEPMRKVFAALKVLLAVQVALACSAECQAQSDPSSAAPSESCLKFKAGLSLGAQLPYTKAKLQTGQRLTIVAFGSSSTTGFGALGFGHAFPDVMKGELLRLRPSANIELINSGRIMDDLEDNIARMDGDVLQHRPDLVIWQLGTNDAVWRGIADDAEAILGNAVKQIKDTGADVILLDLQYTPLVLATGRYTQMEKIIADVAREQKVGQFPRFLLMKRAIEGGVTGLVAWDGLHNSAEGYKCVGLALGQMIDAQAR